MKKPPVKRRRAKGSDRLRHGPAKAPVKRRRAKEPGPLRHGPVQSTPTADEPSMSPQELDARERDAVLRYAADLKRLGIEPAALLRDELRAEEALRRLGYQEDANVPEALRALVGDLMRPSIDGLDAPSLRRALKRAREHKRFFGNRFPFRYGLRARPHNRFTGDRLLFLKARIDLDACAEALRLGPLPGSQPKPGFLREAEALHYGTYLILQKIFQEAKGAGESVGDLLNRFIAENENRSLIKIPITGKEETRAIREVASRARDLVLEPALKRQIEAFNTDKEREKTTRLRGDPLFPYRPLTPAQRCALAMWEAMIVARPAKDEEADVAMAYVRLIQGSFRRSKKQVAKRAKPKES